jgi:hypothetical protein
MASAFWADDGHTLPRWAEDINAIARGEAGEPARPAGPYVRCEACGHHMVVRTNRANGSEFMGCSTWPACVNTMPLPAYVEQIRAGGEPLPGFDL